MKIPENFDGQKFANKYGLQWTDFVVRENTLVCPSMPDADPSDCITDPAEVEADELAEKTRSEKLRALAEWLRTQSKDVREKFADIQSAMESGRSEIAENRQHIKYIEQFISAKYPAAFKPQQWSQTGAAGETGDGQRNG